MDFDLKRRLVLPVSVAVLSAGCGGDHAPQDTQIELQRLEVPAATGSVGPNLATGPDGTLVLSWIEPAGNGHRLLYSVMADGAWSEPGRVAEGDNWFVNWADFPSVVPLSGSLWAAHWLERQPAGGYAYDVLVSLSRDGGAGWSEPVKPHHDNTPTEHGFVTLFPGGDNVALVWLDGRNMVNPPSPEAVNGMTLRHAAITPDLSVTGETLVDGLICDCCQTDVATTADGAIAVYRDRTADEIRDIYLARLTADGWRPGQPVAEDGWNITGCPVNGPVVEAAGERVAIAWFTGADRRPRVRIARSADAGMTLSSPVDVVDEGTSGHVGLALLPDDRLAVSWTCDLPQDTTGVCLRTVSADDEPGPVHVLNRDGKTPPLSVPQLARHGDDLVAAWTEKASSGAEVKSARIPIASLR
jgi:hypothetical protein